jgi:IS30 family transposase
MKARSKRLYKHLNEQERALIEVKLDEQCSLRVPCTLSREVKRNTASLPSALHGAAAESRPVSDALAVGESG